MSNKRKSSIIIVCLLSSLFASNIAFANKIKYAPEVLSPMQWSDIKKQLTNQHKLFGPSIPSYTQEAFLKASNADVGDEFGYSVAISGDTLVVGSRFERSNAAGVNPSGGDNSTSFAGAAYVFVRSGSNWVQQAYLKPSTSGQKTFGWSVAISGETLVVGARFENSASTGVNGDETDNSAGTAGAAYVFARDSNNNWSQQAYLKASNTGSGDNFGSSVGISGDTVVVGAWAEDSPDGMSQGEDTLSTSGAAYVFARDNNNEWSQQAFLKADNADAGDQFARSVAISGKTIVVGAPEEDGNNDAVQNAGAVYVFFRSGQTWSQQDYIQAANIDVGILFGLSVAISSDTLVVGSQSANVAHVFTRNNNNWSQQAILTASNSNAFDTFGHSVAIEDNTIVVGAPTEDSSTTGVDGVQNDDTATNAGAAYVFTRTGTSWSQQAYLKASDTHFGDEFGGSVAVFADTTVIGSHCQDRGVTDFDCYDSNPNQRGGAGAVYVFIGAPITTAVAVDDLKTVVQNTSASTLDVLFNDSPDNLTMITDFTQPPNGTVAIGSNSTDLSYQPDVNYCNNGVTTDDFTYSINSDPVSTATVAVTVECIIAAVDDQEIVNENSTTIIDVLFNDNPDLLTVITFVSTPTHGTVTNNGTDITYVSEIDYCNNGNPTEDFTYSINSTPASTATVAVTIICNAPDPIANNDQQIVNENSNAIIIDVLANDTNAIPTTTVIQSITQPANGTVINSGTNVSYIPNADYCNGGNPTDDFTYTLDSGSTATVFVTVICDIAGIEPQVVPVNQWQWLLLLVLAIIYICFRKNKNLLLFNTRRSTYESIK